MLLLHVALITSILSYVLSAPTLAGALARINEARARALANRVRARANSARLNYQINRSKREIHEDLPFLDSIDQQRCLDSDEDDYDLREAHLHGHGHGHGHFHSTQHIHGKFPIGPTTQHDINPGLHHFPHNSHQSGFNPHNVHHSGIQQTVINQQQGILPFGGTSWGNPIGFRANEDGTDRLSKQILNPEEHVATQEDPIHFKEETEDKLRNDNMNQFGVDEERCLNSDSDEDDYDLGEAHLHGHGHGHGHFHSTQHIHDKFPIGSTTQHDINPGLHHQTGFIPHNSHQTGFIPHNLHHSGLQQTVINQQQGIHPFVGTTFINPNGFRANEDGTDKLSKQILNPEEHVAMQEDPRHFKEETEDVLRDDNTNQFGAEMEDISGQVFDPFNQQERVVDFLKKHQAMKHSNIFRDAVEDEKEDGFDVLSSSFLFNFPRNINKNDDFNIRRKRSTDKKEEFDKIKKDSKRSLPLMRLISDPNVKLDIPKTMDNFGAVSKNALEDERAPMYHVKNLIGSSKNAFMSALRIPPQDLIIPSDYQIVAAKNDPKLRSRNNLSSRIRSSDNEESFEDEEDEEEQEQFAHTFQRMGEIVRNSIKSSQDTVAHMSDMAHDARNIIHTSQYTLPRVIMPYTHVPSVKSTQKLSRPAVLLAPRILDVSENRLGNKANDRPDFVRLGHLMDAVGISKPSHSKVDLEKIVFHPRLQSTHQFKKDERVQKILDRYKQNMDNNIETVGEAVNALNEAKLSVGAKNLRDFLIKMRDELTGRTNNETPKTYGKKLKQELKSLEDKELTQFIENLFNRKKKIQSETVQLVLPPQLRHPFMGRPSKTQLEEFLKSHGDQLTGSTNNIDLNNETLAEFGDFLKNRNNFQEHLEDKQKNNKQRPDLGYVLGAINPLMFERMYNETLKVHNETNFDSRTSFPQEQVDTITEKSDSVGTSMTLTGPMLKPFMGQIQQEKVDEFLANFNEEGQLLEDDDDD